MRVDDTNLHQGLRSPVASAAGTVDVLNPYTAELIRRARQAADLITAAARPASAPLAVALGEVCDRVGESADCCEADQLAYAVVLAGVLAERCALAGA